MASTYRADICERPELDGTRYRSCAHGFEVGIDLAAMYVGSGGLQAGAPPAPTHADTRVSLQAVE